MGNYLIEYMSKCLITEILLSIDYSKIAKETIRQNIEDLFEECTGDILAKE